MGNNGGRFGLRFGNDKALKLQGGIMIYGDTNGAYATYHEVYVNDQNQPALLEGHPLTAAQIGSLVRSLGQNAQVGSFLPENVLSVGMDSLVWWVKPAVREIHFACDGSKGIGTESGMVPYPGLIFAVSSGNWYVFAVKGNKRPTPDTPLYQAPHFNVWEGGKICTGNVSIPKELEVSNLAAWEKAYFGSRFSHPNVTKLLDFKGGAYTFYRSMLDGEFKKFPEKVLVPERFTLGSFINHINGVSK